MQKDNVVWDAKSVVEISRYVNIRQASSIAEAGSSSIGY